MVQYDVEAFMAACERKGLAAKTMGSYEQTLRLFGQFLSVREIERTEEVKRVHIESYIDYLQKRGKYTVCAIDAPANSNNPENRSDYAKKISPTTINNYMRNMKVFFNWCVEQELIYKNPMEKVKYMKMKRKPLEFVSDADFKRLLGCIRIDRKAGRGNGNAAVVLHRHAQIIHQFVAQVVNEFHRGTPPAKVL